MKTVLVLGGGGAKALAHAGAWKALQERGAQVTHIIGTSMGAVIGAALAAGLNAGAWWIITGCGASVLVLGTLTTGRWARGTAERTAGLLMSEPEEQRTPVSAS